MVVAGSVPGMRCLLVSQCQECDTRRSAAVIDNLPNGLDDEYAGVHLLKMFAPPVRVFGSVFVENAPPVRIFGGVFFENVPPVQIFGSAFFENVPPGRIFGSVFFENVPPVSIFGDVFYENAPPVSIFGDVFYENVPPVPIFGGVFYENDPPASIFGGVFYENIPPGPIFGDAFYEYIPPVSMSNSGHCPNVSRVGRSYILNVVTRKAKKHQKKPIDTRIILRAEGFEINAEKHAANA